VLGPLIGWTIWQFRGRPVTDAAVRRVSIALPESTPVALAPWTPLGVGRPSIALSPDASTLVYVTVGDDGVRRLAIRSLDDYEARVLPGTDEAFSPFFSPDGSWVAFFTLDRLRKVALRGGDPVTLCVARNPYGGTWHGDIIVFSDNEGAALVTVPDDGGKPKPVAATSETDATQEYWPRFLPDGRHVIAAVSTSVTFDTQVQAINIETGERTTLVEGGRYPVFLAPGHLLFVREHDLFAVGFDPRRLEVSGDPVPVVQGIRVEAAGAAQVTVSDDGTLAYLPGVRMDRGELVWVDRSGGVESLGFEHELFGTFDLSSDDSRVAVLISQAESQLWMYDLGRGTRVKLTLDGNHGFPTLSPGGDRIAFTSDRDGEPRVYIQELGGGSNPVAVTQGDGRPYSWHPDGGSLAIDYQAGGEWGVGLIDVDGTNLREVAATGDSEWGPAFSPDGNYLAYTDDRTGRYEVYVRELSSERTWQASSEGGEEPLFSSDGKLLLYRNGDSWMEMTVRHEPTFELGRPREVLRGPYLNITGRSYDVSNDGERFLLIRTAERDGLAHDVNVIFNLRAELGR
jgi:serine/threonine-protein kinase